MAQWRAGRSVGRTLYVDGRLVGLVDTPELAAEIVETMNRVGRLLDEVRRHNQDAGFQEFLRTEYLSRVDPYDTRKGGVVDG